MKYTKNLIVIQAAEQIIQLTQIAVAMECAYAESANVRKDLILMKFILESSVNAKIFRVTDTIIYCALDPTKEHVSAEIVLAKRVGQARPVNAVLQTILVCHLMVVRSAQVMVNVSVVLANVGGTEREDTLASIAKIVQHARDVVMS